MFPVLKQDDVTYVVCIMGIRNPSSSVAELQTNLVRSSLKTDKQQSHLENNVEYLRILAFVEIEYFFRDFSSPRCFIFD